MLMADTSEHPDATHWSRAEMLASPHAAAFLAAEDRELQAIEERGVVEAEVPTPFGVKPISSRVVYKFKKGVYSIIY